MLKLEQTSAPPWQVEHKCNN